MIDKIISEDVIQICKDIEKETRSFEGKTLLVAGGSGFIGGYFLDVMSHLNENSLGKSCKLICLDNLIRGASDRIDHLMAKKYFEFINHDVSKPFDFPGNIDFLIHGASIASPTFYRKYPIETIDVNVLGTRNLLDLAAKKKSESVLYLSSSEVYGDPGPENIPTPETYRGNVSFFGPRACYDESKRVAETICIAFHSKHNVPVKIARPFNIYGPGLRLDDKRVIPDFLNNALNDKPIVMHSSGEDTRSFCYISDAMGAFFRILLSDSNGEAFNVGNDREEVSMKELADTINGLFGEKLEIIYEKSEDADYLRDNPRRRRPDLNKTKSYFNYEPKIDLRQGLERSIEWYRSAYKLS